jgi:hypothetical protein
MKPFTMLCLLLALGFLVDVILSPHSIGLIKLGLSTLAEEFDSQVPFCILIAAVAVVLFRAFAPQSLLIDAFAFLLYVAIFGAVIREEG